MSSCLAEIVAEALVVVLPLDLRGGRQRGAAERAFRGVALGPKNRLFAGSDAGLAALDQQEACHNHQQEEPCGRSRYAQKSQPRPCTAEA